MVCLAEGGTMESGVGDWERVNRSCLERIPESREATDLALALPPSCLARSTSHSHLCIPSRASEVHLSSCAHGLRFSWLT